MVRLKKIIEFIYNEFIYGGHLLSISAVGVTITSALLLNIRFSWDFVVVSYLGSQVVYYYNHFKDFKDDIISNPKRAEHIKRYKKLIPFIIILFILIILAIFYYYRNISIVFFTAILISGLLYTKYLKNFTINIVAFKNIIASFVGALLVIFPVVYYSYRFNFSVYLLAVFMFLKWFVTTSFLDIKDIKSDGQKGFLTLPIIFKKETHFKLLILITVLSLVLIIVGIYLNLFPKYSIIIILMSPYTFYYLMKIKLKNANNIFLNYIFVDSEYIIWSIFILFIKYFYV